MQVAKNEPLEAKVLGILARYMDSAFKIPGTNFRFGFDPIINFIPGAGPLVGYMFSSILVLILIRQGASSGLVAKMVGNVVLDSTIGFIPILGNIWDFTNKSNIRNMQLMREYYESGKHTGSVMPLLIGTLLIFILIFVLLFVVFAYGMKYLWELIF